jgi:hypothetical protein
MIITAWGGIEADFHAVYGITDLAGETNVRSWRWFRVRLSGLGPDTNWARTCQAEHERPVELHGAEADHALALAMGV